jgi:fimbrial isopeptide formation D2 family protein
MKRTKVKALLLSISLAAAMSAPSAAGLVAHAASADPVVGVSGEQTDAAAAQTVTVSGLKKDSTVKLYQIVDGYYKDGKLVKYVLMDPVYGKIAAIDTVDENGKHSGPNSTKGQTSNNDIITENEITTIANNIQTGAFTADAGVDMIVGNTADANGNVSATASVEPGMYLVRATDPSDETVYNPAVVAVNITDVNKGTEDAGNIDMTSFFTVEDGNPAMVRNVYLKSSKSGADLKITGSTKAAYEAEGDKAEVTRSVNDYGDTLAEGDTAHFKIDSMTIPSFSEDYLKPQYIITDTIDDSFDSCSNLVVKVGNKNVEKGNTTYTVTNNGNAFKIDFSEDFLRGLRGKNSSEREVEVTYDATLNNASLNFAENHNRATVQYTTNPSSASNANPKDNPNDFHTEHHDTYVYSFGIGVAFDSEAKDNTPGKEITPIFTKVGPNGSVEVGTNRKITVKNALAGATFTLYSDADCKTIAKTKDQPNGTTVSGENGNISFTGLDEGTYYMKETAAPDGYTLTDKTFKFTIKATIGNDGVMTGYEVNSQYKSPADTEWTNGGDAKYTVTTSEESDGSIKNEITSENTDDPVVIVDTKLQTLPSTGGTGIVLIIGVAAALGVAGVALSKKGKQQ